MPERLPPVTVYTTLGEEQRRLYTELRDECLTVLDSGAVIDEQMLMVRMIRMQQVLSGFIGHKDLEGNRTVTEFPCPRVDVAVDEVAQAPGQVVVWCKWQYDVDRLAVALAAEGIACARYYGKLSDDECARQLNAFKEDASIKVLLVTPSKGAESLTILQGTTVIWYSHTWSYLQRKQANDRTYRLGQKERVRYVDLVSEGTMEEKMIKSVEKVQELTDIVRNSAALRYLLG
jgi:SNF2 family DNA or RNA helicase